MKHLTGYPTVGFNQRARPCEKSKPIFYTGPLTRLTSVVSDVINQLAQRPSSIRHTNTQHIAPLNNNFVLCKLQNIHNVKEVTIKYSLVQFLFQHLSPSPDKLLVAAAGCPKKLSEKGLYSLDACPSSNQLR